jgi:hypothetical protein
MKFWKVALILSLLAAGLPAIAQTAGMQVTVPFDFVASGKLLPAGHYTVVQVWKNTQTAWRIRNEKNEGILLTTDEVDSPVKSHHRGLVFLRSGGVYQLVQFWPWEHSGRNMRWSSVKQTLVADSNQVEVAAQ